MNKFSWITLSLLAPLAVGCGDSSTEDEVTEGTAVGVVFDPAEADFGASMADDGQKVVWLSRRNDDSELRIPPAKVLTYDASRAEDDRIEILPGVAEGGVRQARLSPDGLKVAVVREGDPDQLELVGFAGSPAQSVDLGVAAGTRLGDLAWSADSQLVAFTAWSEADDGSRQHAVRVVRVAQSGDQFEVVVSAAQQGLRPQLVRVGGQDYLALNRYETAGSLKIVLLPLTASSTAVTLDSEQAVSTDGPETATGHEFYASPRQLFYSESPALTSDLPTHSRWGNRETEGDDDEANTSVATVITEPLRALELPGLSASTALDFSQYNALAPAEILSVDATGQGQYVLLVGPQYPACENLDLVGTMMLLLNLDQQTVFPLVPTLDDNRNPVGLTSAPCTAVDDSVSVLDQPLDLRVRRAQLIEAGAGEFVVTYETRFGGQLDVYRLSFSATNIDTAGLARNELELELPNEPFQLISQSTSAE